MQQNINESVLENFPSSQLLVSYLKELNDVLDFSESFLYHELILYLNENGIPLKTDVLLVSKEYGIFLFRCLETSERGEEEEDAILKAKNELGEIYSAIYSKLLRYKKLKKNPRALAVEINPILFLSNYRDITSLKDEDWHELHFANDILSLKEKISELRAPLSEDFLDEIISIIEGSKVLIRRTEGEINIDDGEITKRKIVDRIETHIALFDFEQKRAGFNIINKPQRIRGLAGSGKTVILAMKAAQIHLSEPDAEIVYTYWTKTLHDYIKKLITQFYRLSSDETPNWDKIHIMHAWGGRNLSGVYYKTCVDNNVQPKNLTDSKYLGGFNGICKLLSQEALKPSYDYILIDEAQDFPIYFYRVCRKITKNNRIIWAYDECQNILDIKLQNTVDTFGKDENGIAYIDFNSNTDDYQDLVLHKCYRNPRKILISAFALGMGIYSKIIQLPESKALWEDWGFEINSGGYNKNDFMKISRPEINSPLIKNKLIEYIGDEITFNCFDSFDEECTHVSNQIIQDISQGLKPEEIMVLSLDNRYAREYFEEISSQLNEKSISCFNLSTASSYNTKFSIENKITLTTVYHAKGNEAYQVYIVGIDQVFSNKNSISSRNKIFTALTRSKGWVEITGMGDSCKEFCDEMEKIIDNNFELNFTMPDLKELKVFQRDLQKMQSAYNTIRRTVETQAKKLGIDPKDLTQDFAKLEGNK